MNIAEQILLAMNDIDERYLAESENRRKFRLPLAVPLAAAAAAVMLVIVSPVKNAPDESKMEITNGPMEEMEEDAAAGAFDSYTDAEPEMTCITVYDSAGREISEEEYAVLAQKLNDAGFEAVYDGILQINIAPEEIGTLPYQEQYSYQYQQMGE